MSLVDLSYSFFLDIIALRASMFSRVYNISNIAIVLLRMRPKKLVQGNK